MGERSLRKRATRRDEDSSREGGTEPGGLEPVDFGSAPPGILDSYTEASSKQDITRKKRRDVKVDHPKHDQSLMVSTCSRPLVDQVDEPENVVDRGLWHDPVAEVEDVARAASGPIQDADRVPSRPPRTGRTGRPGRGCLGRRPTVRADPSRRARSIRQSSPITVPPASRWSSSRVEVSVPKWIEGTEGSSAAKSRRM